MNQREAMCLHLPVQLKEALREHAKRQRRSMTREIQVALEKHLAKDLRQRRAAR